MNESFGTNKISIRDLRLDLYRGVTLFLILLAHMMQWTDIPVPFFMKISPVQWGLCSAIAIFVFISGYVYGLVYSKYIKNNQFSLVFLKTFKRAWSLYVINVLTLVITFGLLCLLQIKFPEKISMQGSFFRFFRFFRFDAEHVWAVLTMRYMPDLLDILPLFIFLSLMAPFFLFLIRKRSWLGLLLSFLLWGINQFQMNISLPYFTGGLIYNPLAFQFLFVLGIFFGCKRPKIFSKKLSWITSFIVILSAVKVWLFPRLIELGIPTPDRFTDILPLTHRVNLEPLRLFYFLCLAYTVACLSRNLGITLNRPSGLSKFFNRVFIFPGQHALEVFAFGVVFTYLFSPFLRAYAFHWIPLLILVVIGWIFSIGFAKFTLFWKSIDKQKPAIPSEKQ